MTVWEELKARGLIAQVTDEDEIKEMVNNGKATFYIGFDPTADSLHVGHFMALCLMKRLQMAGNRPIALLGGGTGMIGDPSGRTDMRQMMTKETIQHNIDCFKKQMSRFIDFSDGKALMVNNADWLLKLNYVELLREVGMVKNGLCHLKDFHSKYLTQDEFAEVFRSYEHQKKELKKFDFDDMLVQCYALFRKKPEILQGWQKRFQYILIDEFQDINRVQYEVIRMLAAPRYNLFVVGDDDQSIYGFRGAKPELMLYMKQEFPSLRTISLTVNYRSTEFITGAAARVILHNDTRFYKRVQSFRGRGQNVHVQEVLDEQEEAQYVTEEIQKKLDQGIKPGEIAVLFRAAVQARMISEILSEHRIPFEMRDYVTNFYRHFIVKDMMAYLQLAAGKRDRSLFLTICNRPLRYLARNSMENRQVNFEDLRKFYCDKDWMLDIIDQFDVDVRMMKNMAPYAAIQYIRKKIGYDDFLKEYAEKHQISWKQLMDVMAELEERSKNFKSYDEWEIHIAKYTQELEEQQAKARKIKGERENKVQLMTIHSAKGLEFEDVFVIHANEGEIPHQKAEKKDEIEEERRLFYVALTRAKNNLCISYITQKNGNSIKPSRFVEELLGQRIK